MISRFPRLNYKAINSGCWKFSSHILGTKLEEEQAKSRHVKECGVQILGYGIAR